MSSSHSLRFPIGLVAGVGVALIMACNTDHEEDDTQFRKDVIWCEEAVSHLEDCCGATFDARQIECRHFYEKDTGCGQTSITRIDPAYTIAESECVRDQSCDAIRTNKICERALAAGMARTARYENDTLGSTTSTSSSSIPISSSSTSSTTGAVGTTSTSTTSGSSAAGAICP